jgi:hypothetical protein
MVCLTTKVRPKRAYSPPGNVVDATFDSATRFEETKVQLELGSKTNSSYYNGQFGSSHDLVEVLSFASLSLK